VDKTHSSPSRARRHRAEALDPRAHLAGALGQRLGQLRRVDVAIIGVVKRAGQVMRFEEGIARLDLVRAKDVRSMP
jgi:hypothetical protein